MLQRSLESQRIDRGADRVRAEMGKARVRAMRSGDIHAFFYKPGGDSFKVAKFDFAIAELMKQLHQDQKHQRSTNFDFADELLPRGVRFAAADVVFDARAEQAVGGKASQGKNMRPILFYPDGTSQDATLSLQNEQNDLVEIQLRGLTGIATIRRVFERSNIR
jgi:hypothetical protein